MFQLIGVIAITWLAFKTGIAQEVLLTVANVLTSIAHIHVG